jgi:hypothetical protein
MKGRSLSVALVLFTIGALAIGCGGGGSGGGDGDPTTEKGGGGSSPCSPTLIRNEDFLSNCYGDFDSEIATPIGSSFSFKYSYGSRNELTSYETWLTSNFTSSYSSSCSESFSSALGERRDSYFKIMRTQSLLVRESLVAPILATLICKPQSTIPLTTSQQ